MLTLLIPGPNSPDKDMDVLLRPVVDELKDLLECDIQTSDAVDNSVFNMHVELVWIVNDFPARSSISGWSDQGYKAYPTCNNDTISIRVIGKETYIGHRRFFLRSHSLRNNK